MLRKSKIKAEELLAEENFSEELLSQNAKDGNVDENEIRIARKVYSFLRSSSESLIDSEKEQTKNHIRSSIRKLYTKKLLVRWSIAATLLFAAILTSVVYIRISSTTEIVNFAQTLNHIKAGNNTRIILQNGEEVRIDKTQSQIKYDTKGENILIDSEQRVVQKTDNTKTVFNTVIVPYGKRIQITLSEGTKVWLNSGSKLVYPAVFVENKREVYIDGEAVFDVMHMKDKPFVVSTKDFDIKVLGTVFNVSAYSDDKYSSTVLEMGKIELICRGASILSQEKLDISPGTMAVYDRNQKIFEQKQVDPRKYLSWREGYLILNSEKLENILRKLGRYYNIEMVITDNYLKNATFSGYLDLKNSPQEVLSVVNETTSLSYSIDHEKIFINPK
jgi:transmembrane sensor